MEAVFLKLLNMSITAGWIVLAVIVLRFLLKKAPKAMVCVLWALVAVRLICPFSIESVLSLIPSVETVPQEIVYSESPAIRSGIAALNQVVNPVISQSLAPEVGASVNPMQVITFAASVIWIIGMAAMVLYAAISYFRVRSKVKISMPLQGNVLLCDDIATPFILGVFRPRIYLPSAMSREEAEYVIAHEQAHLKRRDHWWKPLGFALLTVYWFNSLLWIAYVLLCRDIELACDERVVRNMKAEEKKAYSSALLNCSTPRRMVSACPLAFGEVGVKSRIKSVFNYKKPAFWIIVAAVVVCAAAAVCFLTNPKQNEPEVPLSVSVGESGSAREGISIEFVSIKTGAESPYLELRWRNRTGVEYAFGEEFYIYRKVGDSWEDCRLLDEYFWQSIATLLPGDGTVTKKYSLKDIDMTQPGTYRFESEGVWIEFELKANQLDEVHTYDPVELVYDCAIYSYVQTAETAPDYRVVNGVQLQERRHGESEWRDLGAMSEIALGAENFNERFLIDAIWYGGETAESIKSGNKRTWELCVAGEDYDELYQFLEQQDGTFYIAYGVAGQDSAHIRWLYRVEDVSSVSGEGTEYGKTVDETVSCYGYLESVDPVTPTIMLWEDSGEFQFMYSGYSSYIAHGAYELTDELLTLRTDDGKYSYVFRAQDDTFIFDEERSSKIPKYRYSADAYLAESPVPDGAVFKQMLGQ